MAQYIKLLRQLIIKRLAVFISLYDRLFKKSAVSGCNFILGNISTCAYNDVKYSGLLRLYLKYLTLFTLGDPCPRQISLKKNEPISSTNTPTITTAVITLRFTLFLSATMLTCLVNIRRLHSLQRVFEQRQRTAELIHSVHTEIRLV